MTLEGSRATLAYDVVDVFADAAFAGNQLAVVHGAEALSDDQLLALTREFGFSETTFPAACEGQRYRVRIFTPGGEIPFAGHPTLGTAWVLRDQGWVGPGSLTQDCGAGEVGVRFDGDLVELAATPRDLVGPLPDDTVAALLADLGLTRDDRSGPAWAAGAGLTFVHVPVRPEAIARARAGRTPVAELVTGLGLEDPLDGVNVYSLEGFEPFETVAAQPPQEPTVAAQPPQPPSVVVRSRVFVPGLSVPEDPATGSAAAGLGMALVASGVLPEGGTYEITQGVELGRPSRLFGRIEAATGVATRCHVAGRVFPVAHGTIAVPRR